MMKTIKIILVLFFDLILIQRSDTALFSSCNINTSIPSATKLYNSGAVQSKRSFKFGRFEVRMKPSRKSGIVSSFFTYLCNPLNNCETGEEIDIEFVGSNQAAILNSIHHPTDKTRSDHPFPGILNFNSGNDFHIYSFEWTSNYIAWYADRDLIKRIDNDKVNNITELVNEQYIMLNLWSSIECWGGPLNLVDIPVTVVYDWVKWYSWSDADGFSVKPEWEDDFSDLKLSEWNVLNETFPVNSCDFSQSNYKVSNGYLTLILTQKPGISNRSNGACLNIYSVYPLGARLAGKQAKGFEGDFSCSSDVFPECGIRISPEQGAGRVYYDFGPLNKNSITITFQWIDNAWLTDNKTLELYNWNTKKWEQICEIKKGNQPDELFNFSLNNVTQYYKGPENQIRVSIYCGAFAVIHLNWISVF